MRRPSLTVDTFVAALAVLGIGSSMGCAKAEKAAPDRATTTSQPEKATNANAPGAAPTAAAPAPAPAPVASAPLDAGRTDAKAAHASCGAGGCSPDMKKGN